MPMWLRQSLYLIVLAVAVPAQALGWADESIIAEFVTIAALALAPGIALANLADKPDCGGIISGRHRAE